MIRVCHLITDLNAGGAERTLVNVVTRLDRTRFSSHVVSMIKPGILAGELAEKGIPLVDLGMPRGRPTLAGLGRMVRHVRRTKPDILQTWLYHADLLGTMTSWFAPGTSLMWNVRCSDLMDTPGESQLRRIIHVLAWSSKRPRAVIVNSDSGKAFHARAGYSPRRWMTIPNGVDSSRFRPNPDSRQTMRSRLGISAQTVVIGLVARFHPMKDHATFLRAAARFAAAHPDCCFVLCGEGINSDNSALTGLISEMALGERVLLLGVRADMERIYPVFDVLALPSAFGEGFPNVLIEAMACGIPCVATDVGDSRAIVGDTGLVVPPADAAALVRAWTSLLGADSAALARRARERAIERYSIDRVCELYAASYEEIAPLAADRP